MILNDSKEDALSKFSDNVDSYTGLNKTQGNHYRHFIDIEPNRSVRPGFKEAIIMRLDQMRLCLNSSEELLRCAWTLMIRLELFVILLISWETSAVKAYILYTKTKV